MTNSETTFAEAMAKWQAEREAANKAARNELLPQLRGLGCEPACKIDPRIGVIGVQK